MLPDRAFLDELRGAWTRNFVATILYARLNHQRIPREVMGDARRMQNGYEAQRDVNASVKVMLGNMGMDAGLGQPLMADPEAFMFTAAMGLIVAHGGNPPAAAELQAQAEYIVTGKADPMSAFELAMGGDVNFAALWT